MLLGSCNVTKLKEIAETDICNGLLFYKVLEAVFICLSAGYQ